MPSDGSPPTSASARPLPWWRELTRYHWFVLVVASLGWLFDTMDQQLFILARKPAITALLQTQPSDPLVEKLAGYTTSIFIMGWALGGLIFGILGDRIGRVKTMLLTILVYSIFTGLSALSFGVVDFALYRFLTGLGVGGEFAVGVALVAETMPDRARPHALGWLQAFSAIGNMLAAVTVLLLSQFQAYGAVTKQSSWKVMFLVGIVPALLALPIMRRLREPERWKAAAQEGKRLQLGSIRELFGTPLWRRNTIVGMLLAFAGVVGLWGIGFFSPELIRSVLRPPLEAEGLSGDKLDSELMFWTSITSMLQNFGSFLGVYAFSRFSHVVGRKPAFAIGFILAPLSTAFTFWFLRERSDVLWMIPIMGFCQLTVFGGYAIYFPELFPTRLRSTGTSFCYNVGRFVAAVGPFTFGLLVGGVFKDYPEPMRYGGVVMCVFFLVGLVVLPFAPETKGKPLPE
jgi:MFS family permease